MRLFEKHRPRSLEEVVGQERAVSTVRRLIDRGVGGSAVWLSGPSGAGNTTLARIIAESVADPFFVREYDSADQLTGAELDDLERTLRLSAWGKGGRAVILNEAHGLRQSSIRRLLGMLENIPARVVWVATTTWDGEEALFDGIDASPLLSRFTPIRLTNQGLAKVFAERVRTIAQAEGLDGQPVEAYVKLLQKHKNNCRAALNEIEAGAMLVGGAA
jgi:replication-associated recombination protein RarA